jgi:hypothetical protein
MANGKTPRKHSLVLGSADFDQPQNAEDWLSFFDLGLYYAESDQGNSSPSSSSDGRDVVSEFDQDFLDGSPSTPGSSVTFIEDLDPRRYSPPRYSPRRGSSPPTLYAATHDYVNHDLLHHHSDTHTIVHGASEVFPGDNTHINGVAYHPELDFPPTTLPLYPQHGMGYQGPEYSLDSSGSSESSGRSIGESHRRAASASPHSDSRRQKRPRTLKDAEKIHHVRKTGACLHCCIGRLAVSIPDLVIRSCRPESCHPTPCHPYLVIQNPVIHNLVIRI